ncbi:uncharacterized protein LOC109433261 isoform X2 [Aedes albopictus]|uniref:Rad21/Rec8-like protein N-terminal domain-containing protein n=1 Tax=Aedes albopictus TaxID=7160 RepID=A0ABM1XN86_AEDAL
MYVELDLFSVRKNGRLAAMWLAATNKTLFRRYFKRGQCEQIDIDEMCKSIIDCVNSNKPLIMVAKLAYGAVYIYQQQIQFLYDKVSTTACLQSAAFQDFKRQSSLTSKSAYNKKGTRTSSLDDRYEECLPDPALAPEEIIAQLLTDDQSAKVVHIGDITMRESLPEGLSVIESTLQDQDNGFGEMKLQELGEFLGSSPNESASKDTHNDSGIEQDTTGSGLEDLPRVIDRTIREATIDESHMGSTSMAMIDMPIASTSAAQLQEVDMTTLTNSFTHPDTEHHEKTSEISRISNDVPEPITPKKSNSQPFAIIAPEDSGIATTLSSTKNKKSQRRRTIVDQKTKLDSEGMKRSIENSSSTQRCKNPRFDIVPLDQVRHPFDNAVTILQHPVRSMRSSVLPALFTRNARKRTADVEDLLLQEWSGDLELPAKRKRSLKESTRTPATPPATAAQSSPVDVSMNCTNLTDQEQTIEILPLPLQQDIAIFEQADARNINVQLMENSATIGPEREIDETNLITLLADLWNKGRGPITMKLLEGGFSTKYREYRG